MQNQITKHRHTLILTLLSMVFIYPLFAVTTPDVTPLPDSTNTYSEYTIISRTGTPNKSALQANSDSIFVIFNSSTTVPTSISSSYISINNTTSNAVAIHGQTIAILTPVNLPTESPFTIVIDAGAQVQNPSSSGNYTLQVYTSSGASDKNPVTSNAYTISQSTSHVTPAATTPNPSVATESAEYSISFNTGGSGQLTANDGIIYVTFPSTTTIPSGTISGVTINGTSASATSDGDTVLITTPTDIDNSGAVNVNFAIGSGLKNPSTEGQYNVQIKTSTETDLITSDPYTISPAGQLSISAITSKPDTVNQGGEFAFDFRIGSSGALVAGTDTIYVIFPNNTYLPQDMSRFNVSVSSGGFSDNAADLVIRKATGTDGDTVKVVTPINISNSTDVELTFSAGSGYLNPSIAGNYTIHIKTNKEASIVESNPYSIVNTSTRVSQASVTPATTSYTVDFNLGRLGRLVDDLSTITLTFNSGYALSENTAHYDASTITIAEGSAISIADTNITISNTDKTIKIIIPKGTEIQNGNNIVIYLGDSSDQPITDPADGNYGLGVQTSVEASKVNSIPYNIGGTGITINSVTLSEPTVNNPSEYTFDITNVNILDVDKQQQQPDDFIKITFPDGTILPSTIETSDVELNSDNARNVSINHGDRSITVIPNSDISSNTRFDIIFSSSANIINPIVPSSTFYKATISTSTDEAPVTSSAYAITGDNTQTTSSSLTANPSAINATNVVYSLGFTTSTTGKIAGGKPAGSSTITMDFDTGTIIPATISASTVEINSTPCTAVSVDASGAGGIITATLPNGLTIDNSSSATVNFTAGAGLSNNSSAGTFKVSVRTSSDNTYSSTTGTNGDYTITANQPLAVNSVSPNPVTQNANASYSIKFNVGSSGGLVSGSSTIDITFPTNTYLPSVVSKSDISINGSTPANNPVVAGNKLTIITPVNVANLAEVTVLINQTGGILNPTTVQNYTVDVATSIETGPFTSPVYAITQTSSTVSAADISIASAATSIATAYTVDFNVGTNGRLIAGTSTISITFGSATGVSTTLANYTNSTISVNGGTAVSIASSIAFSSKTVIITVPASVTIGNDDQISILLDDDATDPITNPGTADSYQLDVKTSVEATDVTSNSYSISNVGAVTSVSATLGASMVNAGSSYSVSFITTNDLSSGDLITITFPDNTYIPPTISSGITVNSSSVSGVSTNPSSRQVVITLSSTIAAGTISVEITSVSGLGNPSILGDYTLDVNTSEQPINGTSASYTLTQASSSVTNFSITVTPTEISVDGEYQFDFSTGTYGRLVSGTSQIFILFPKDIAFTLGTPTTSKVTVNSTAAAAVTLNGHATNPDTLIVTVPSSVTIGNSTSVTVVVDESAGVRNASSTSTLTYSVYTSVENTLLDGDHSLPVELSSFMAEDNKGKVLLNWLTESETNNAFWIIKRSLNSSDEFEEIARIDGQGSTSSATQYEFVDNNIEVGVQYIYSLTSVSIDGRKVEEATIEIVTRKPVTFKLAQNYPNPFNGGTTIRFSIPDESKVKITIFNILGQKITTLVNESYKAGFHQVRWDGQNNINIKAATGLYIYVMEAEGFRSIKKMLYMK